METNTDIQELKIYIDLLKTFLGRYVEVGSIYGFILSTEDEAQLKRVIIEVHDFLKESFGDDNIYSVNIINAINTPTMGGSPSYASIQDVIGILQAAVTKRERQKQRNERKIDERDDSITQNGYDIAQICVNGHVINDSTLRNPQFNKKFCDRCGSETITECLNCKTSIQGHYHEKEIPGKGTFSAPAFCQYCGNAFPWTASRIETAKKLAQEDENISSEEKEVIVKSIDDIIADTPRTTLAANKFKNVLAKMGASAAGILKEVLVDVASETAKKIIWPDK